MAITIRRGGFSVSRVCGIGELSFLKLGTVVEEFLEGYQIVGRILLGYQISWQKCEISNGLRSVSGSNKGSISFKTKVKS